jgi:PAS domain-containing protein
MSGSSQEQRAADLGSKTQLQSLFDAAPIVHPTGEEMTFDISFYPIRNEQGEVVLLVPEGRNITTLKHAEAALRESEARFRTICTSP